MSRRASCANIPKTKARDAYLPAVAERNGGAARIETNSTIKGKAPT
jgi:hypothetical protein